MRDCPNGEMRDRLPELMHNRLEGESLRAVLTHVAGCAECRAELALLEQLRAVPVAPHVEVSRIVAALPRYRPVPAWRRAMASGQLRAAAAAIVLVLGGYSVIQRGSTARMGDTVAGTQAQASPELAIGDSFQDLSDSDLAAVIESLGEIEAVTPEASEEPILQLAEPSNRSGGGA